MNRRIVLIAALLAVAAVSVAGIATAGGTSPSAVQATKPMKVTVTMTEFKFRLTNTATKKVVKTVPKGTRVAFTVLNKGDLGHDFDIPGLKNMPVIGGGKKFTNYTVTFKKAGQIRYVCTVPLHAGNGMQGNLRVR
jgi:uncharacterized cupredoxin-like copper-binding protein